MTESLAIGIDIGGTNTTFGIVNRRGEILAKGILATKGHDRVEAYISSLAEEIRPVIDKLGQSNMSGVGVGVPNGNYYTGEIIFAPNLPWKGIIPLAELLGNALGLRVKVTNDANAAAIGEMTYGNAKGMKDFILVTLGTGLGSGFVVNGEMVYGHDGFAGELGHLIVEREGRLCGCGRKGCLETYVSATGIVRTAEEWLAERNTESILREYKNLNSEVIFEAAEKGDALALELFEFTGKILGQTLADMVAITSPEAIIFFGGLARAGDILMKPVQKHMEANLMRIYQNKVALLQSALPDSDAAILGASALAW